MIKTFPLILLPLLFTLLLRLHVRVLAAAAAADAAPDEVPFDFSLFHETGQQHFGVLSVSLNATRAILADQNGICPASAGKQGSRQQQPQQQQQQGSLISEVHLEFCMNNKPTCVTSAVPERMKGLAVENKIGLLLCYTGRLDPAYGKLYGRPVETRHQVPNVEHLKMAEACQKLFPGVMYSPWHGLFVEFVGADAENKTVTFLLQSSISRKNHTVKLGPIGQQQSKEDACFSIRLGPQLVTDIVVLADDVPGVDPGGHVVPRAPLLAVEPPILEKESRADFNRYLINGGLVKKVAGLWLLGLDMLRGLDDRNWVYLAGTPTAEGKPCISAKIRVPFDGQQKFVNCKSWWAPVKAAYMTETLEDVKEGNQLGNGKAKEVSRKRGGLPSIFYAVRAGYVEGKKVTKPLGWEEDKNLKVLVEYVKTILPLVTGQLLNGHYVAEDEQSWVDTVEKTALALQRLSYGNFFYVQVPAYWKVEDDRMAAEHGQQVQQQEPAVKQRDENGHEVPEDNTGALDYVVDMLFHRCGETPAFASFARQKNVLFKLTGQPQFDWSQDLTFLEGCSLKSEDRTPSLPHHIGSKVLLFQMDLGFQGQQQQFDEVRQLATQFKFGLSEDDFPLRDFYKRQKDGQGLGRPDIDDPCFGHYKRTGQKVDKTLVEDPLLASFTQKHRTVRRAFHSPSSAHFKQFRVRQQYFECKGQGQLDDSKFWLPFVCVLEQNEKAGWQPIDAALEFDCEKCLGRAQCSCTIF